MGRKRTLSFYHKSTYASWNALKQRCLNPKDQNYWRYGGRGIKVCERWAGRNSFSNFFADMGPRPSPKHSIDRIDNNGDYSPENCRWATSKEQQQNTRHNRILTLNGESQLLVTWAKKLKTTPSRIGMRISRGWSEEKALSQPVKKKPRVLITHQGQTHTVSQWARILNIQYDTLKTRLRNGMPPAEALTSPVLYRKPRK